MNNSAPEDTNNLRSHARQNAQEAILAARMQAQLFDAERALERKANEGVPSGVADMEDTGGSDNDPEKALVDRKNVCAD